ncbi:MAG: dihydropteroate synthase [Acidimicrobiales bacterium]
MARATTLRLGKRTYDISSRGLVMGICNRTPDSFFDHGEYFAFDRFLSHAERAVEEGADILDVGGVKAGPGPEVSTAEEMERVIPAVEALQLRFDLPISVDTWSSPVAEAAYGAGAVLGNDISGFSDPEYLKVAAAAGASVVATHIRLAPRVADPEPRYADLVKEVIAFLSERVERARAAGLASDQIVVDAGLDLGKSPEQSLELLRASGELAAIGQPLLLSASNKAFLGAALGLDVTERRNASLSAAAIGLARGCRIVRAHDVAGSVKVRDVLAAIGSAR